MIIFNRVILILLVILSLSGCFDVIHKGDVHDEENMSFESSITVKHAKNIWQTSGKKLFYGTSLVPIFTDDNADKLCESEIEVSNPWWTSLVAEIKKLIDIVISFFTPDLDVSMLEEREGLVFLIGDDDPFTGKMVGQYKNGQDKLYREYKDGLVFGEWKEWHENGNEKISGKLVEGAGVIKHFDLDGNRTKD